MESYETNKEDKFKTNFKFLSNKKPIQDKLKRRKTHRNIKMNF